MALTCRSTCKNGGRRYRSKTRDGRSTRKARNQGNQQRLSGTEDEQPQPRGQHRTIRREDLRTAYPDIRSGPRSSQTSSPALLWQSHRDSASAYSQGKETRLTPFHPATARFRTFRPPTCPASPRQDRVIHAMWARRRTPPMRTVSASRFVRQIGLRYPIPPSHSSASPRRSWIDALGRRSGFF